MEKRRSVEEFRIKYKICAKEGAVREFEAYFEVYAAKLNLDEETKRAVLEQFKRDAEDALRSSSTRLPK
jgi:hypothetical protein